MRVISFAGCCAYHRCSFPMLSLARSVLGSPGLSSSWCAPRRGG
jgi:hypothetical protein